MIHKPHRKEDFVVKLLNKNNRTRDVIVQVDLDPTSHMPYVYNFYKAGVTAIEEKAKEGEIVIRVSRKGYS